MKKLILSLVLVLWLAPSAYAQGLGALAGGTFKGSDLVHFIDGLTPPASSPKVQKAADIASWGTYLGAASLDAVDVWQSDNRTRGYVTMGARDAVVAAAVWSIKKAVHRTRPCAPACGIDNADSSFLSGHTAFATSSINWRGNHKAVQLSLAVGTGAGRIIGKKHWLTDVLAGAALGGAASWIR